MNEKSKGFMEAANYSPSLKNKDIEDAKTDNILENTLISYSIKRNGQNFNYF